MSVFSSMMDEYDTKIDTLQRQLKEAHDLLASGEALREKYKFDNITLTAQLAAAESQLKEAREFYTERLPKELKHPEFFGCFTGDCPHEDSAECLGAIQAYIIDTMNICTSAQAEVTEKESKSKRLHAAWFESQSQRQALEREVERLKAERDDFKLQYDNVCYLNREFVLPENERLREALEGVAGCANFGCDLCDACSARLQAALSQKETK